MHDNMNKTNLPCTKSNDRSTINTIFEHVTMDHFYALQFISSGYRYKSTVTYIKNATNKQNCLTQTKSYKKVSKYQP